RAVENDLDGTPGSRVDGDGVVAGRAEDGDVVEAERLGEFRRVAKRVRGRRAQHADHIALDGRRRQADVGEGGAAAGVGRYRGRAEVIFAFAVAGGVGGRTGVEVQGESGAGATVQGAAHGGRRGAKRGRGNHGEVLVVVGPGVP